jgi:hypothetical protein
MEIDSGFGFQQDRRGTGLDANLARLKKTTRMLSNTSFADVGSLPCSFKFLIRRSWHLTSAAK